MAGQLSPCPISPLGCPVISSCILQSGASRCRVEKGHRAALQPAEMLPCSPQHPREELHSLPAAWQHACFLGHKARRAKCFPKGGLHGHNTSHVLPASGSGCCSPCSAGPCSIPRQWGQGSAQLKGISPELSPCSFCCCKISPSCLLYFELMTGCPLSTSTLLLRELECHSLLQNSDLGCDTIWGEHVAPHQCLA